MKNDQLPRIRVFYAKSRQEDAEQVGYGIEEEGLPYVLEEVENPEKTALQNTTAAGLGVAVSAEKSRCCIFCRQLKETRPYMIYQTRERDILKRAGKNAARMVKNSPFVY